MAITSITQARVGSITTVTALSDLTPPAGGSVFYHWYLDGLYLGVTTVGQKTFKLADGELARVDVLDTTSESFDPIASAPDGYPARRWVWWVRSLAADVAAYVVQQKKGAGSFVEIARVARDADAWEYAVRSPRLDDLSDYTWRVLAVDAAGNSGTHTEIGPERVVRTPDAPNFTTTFNNSTKRVTFTAVA